VGEGISKAKFEPSKSVETESAGTEWTKSEVRSGSAETTDRCAFEKILTKMRWGVDLEVSSFVRCVGFGS
jgi:hypothetical protein